MRSEPSHRAEQVNEMLYGERAEVLEVNEDNWARIRCEWDGYEGWCRFGQLTMTNRKEYRKPAKAVAASHTDRILFEQGDQWVPMGSDLFGFKKSLVNFKGDTGKYKGKKLALKKNGAGCSIAGKSSHGLPACPLPVGWPQQGRHRLLRAHTNGI